MPSLQPAQLAFFSYAHEDAEFALRLAKDLRAGGAAVWIDRLDIKPGQRWDRAIEDALAKCPQLLVILSPDATESTNVMDEVSLALEEGKTVLPVVHRQCKIPFRLRRLQYVDLTLNYNEGLGRLLETLGFAVPALQVPEDTVDHELTRPSRHDSGAKEAKLFSHATPQEDGATARMQRKRAPWVIVIVGTAAVVIALALLTLVLNAFKKKEMKSSEEVSQGPTTSLTPLSVGGPRTPEPSVKVAENHAGNRAPAKAYDESPSVPREKSKTGAALPNFAGTWEMISWVENGTAKPVPDNGRTIVITQNGSMVRVGNHDLQISNAGTIGYQSYFGHDNASGREVSSAAQADLIDMLTWRIEGSILVFESTFEYKHTYGNHPPGTNFRVIRYRRIDK